MEKKIHLPLDKKASLKKATFHFSKKWLYCPLLKNMDKKAKWLF
jgi:hypothetical protein